jgi:lycopene cyclase domain-containing protein
MSLTYLLVDLGVISIPFIASFDKRIRFNKSWDSFLKAFLITATFFIVWDIWFTESGVWGFNAAYLAGFQPLSLPIEEWLFFLAVPYACTFTWFVFRKYLKLDFLAPLVKPIWYLLIVLCLYLIFSQYGRNYTFYTALFTLFFLVIIAWRKKWNEIRWFLFTYLIIIIPFTLSNGVLTGLEFWQYPVLHNNPEQIVDQIVWYNNDHNLGWRFFSIPIDDFLYSFLLQGMSITLFNYFEGKKPNSASTAR